MFSVYADDQSIFFPLDDELIINKPKLTLEMGKAGSFEFSIPPTNRFYARMQQLKTIITVEYDGVVMFRGRVLKNTRSFNNVRKIYCEGELAYLVDSVQKGEKYTGTTHDLFNRIIANHNARVEAAKQFTVGNITIDNREIVIAGTSEEIQDLETGKFDYKQIAINSMTDDWSTTFDYIQSTIIDYCGGYLRIRRVNGANYLDLLKDYGSTSIQKIEFGKNLIDLTEEVKAEDVYTVLIPLGDDNLTIASVNNGSDELVDQAGVERYGRIIKTNVFDSVNDPNTLLENGRRMLESHENMPITFTVKAVDMHLVDQSTGMISVGDKVYVNSIPHDITDYLTCTKIEYDFENHANDTYTFGNPKQTMTERYRKDKEKSSKHGKGRSGGGGGGGGAAAMADAAAEDYAISEADKMGKEIFDAYIQVDPAAGKITLAALYAQMKGDREILKRNVGINLDAPAGTVDIYSMNTQLNEQGKNIQSSEARIQTLADNQQAQIKSFTDFKSETSSSLTNITQRATATESTVEILSQFKSDATKSIDGLRDNEARISQKVDANSASIESLTRFRDSTNASIASISQTVNANSSNITLLAQHDSNYGSRIASVEAKASKNASTLTLKADITMVDSKVTTINGRLEALEGRFDSLYAGSTTTITLAAKRLLVGQDVNAETVRAGKIYMSAKLVATQEWVTDQLKKYASSSHKHTVNIGHYHKVTVKALNSETSTGGVQSSLNVTKTTSAPT